jgi:uncharacterized membrane protein (UPF0127 family)
MRFPIDVVYLDKYFSVTQVRHRMRPWTLGVRDLRLKTWHVLELAAGRAAAVDIRVGDLIRVGVRLED